MPFAQEPEIVHIRGYDARTLHSPACGAALVARRDAIYRVQSAAFPTNGKAMMTRVDPGGATVDALAAYAFNRTSS